MELITFLIMFMVFSALTYFNISNRFKIYGNIFGVFAGLFLIFMALMLATDPVGIEYVSGFNETISGNVTTRIDTYSPISQPGLFNWNNILALFFFTISMFMIFYNAVEAGIEYKGR